MRSCRHFSCKHVTPPRSVLLWHLPHVAVRECRWLCFSLRGSVVSCSVLRHSPVRCLAPVDVARTWLLRGRRRSPTQMASVSLEGSAAAVVLGGDISTTVPTTATNTLNTLCPRATACVGQHCSDAQGHPHERHLCAQHPIGVLMGNSLPPCAARKRRRCTMSHCSTGAALLRTPPVQRTPHPTNPQPRPPLIRSGLGPQRDAWCKQPLHPHLLNPPFDTASHGAQCNLWRLACCG